MLGSLDSFKHPESDQQMCDDIEILTFPLCKDRKDRRRSGQVRVDLNTEFFPLVADFVFVLAVIYLLQTGVFRTPVTRISMYIEICYNGV